MSRLPYQFCTVRFHLQQQKPLRLYLSAGREAVEVNTGRQQAVIGIPALSGHAVAAGVLHLIHQGRDSFTKLIVGTQIHFHASAQLVADGRSRIEGIGIVLLQRERYGPIGGIVLHTRQAADFVNGHELIRRELVELRALAGGPKHLQ